MNVTLGIIAQLLQASAQVGFTVDDMGALADWIITRFAGDYTDAEKANLRANAISYAEQLAALAAQIRAHDLARAQAAATPAD